MGLLTCFSESATPPNQNASFFSLEIWPQALPVKVKNLSLGVLGAGLGHGFGSLWLALGSGLARLWLLLALARLWLGSAWLWLGSAWLPLGSPLALAWLGLPLA